MERRMEMVIRDVLHGEVFPTPLSRDGMDQVGSGDDEEIVARRGCCLKAWCSARRFGMR